MDSVSLASAVGAAAKKHRTGHGTTLDSVAREARSVGLRWSESRVGDFEGGRVAPALGTLIAAAAAYGAATNTVLTLVDLVPNDVDRMEITATLTFSADKLRRILGGGPVEASAGDVYTADEIRQSASDGLAAIRKAAVRFPDVALADVEAAERAAGTATDRIARDLGQPRHMVVTASVALWGHAVETERDRIAGPHANAQKKGQVLRALKAELRAAVDGND